MARIRIKIKRNMKRMTQEIINEIANGTGEFQLGRAIDLILVRMAQDSRAVGEYIPDYRQPIPRFRYERR